jgi:ABC-2 type transport system ATP-binding protein
VEEIAIQVTNVSKAFKLPHEKQGSIKNMFVGMFRSKKTYERQLVLNNVSFNIKKGEFFGIVGRNGSGKSTLLKLLAGVYSPDKGAIHINGKLTPFIELGVGFNPELTGRENVFLNGALLGFSRTEIEKMYDEIVEFAELKKFMDQKLKNYSSGMQVRLAFSIAIRAQTDILLLDEVLAVGDAAFQQKCYNYFEELRQNKKTVVFVSHDMSALTRFCTSAVYVKNGRLIHQGSATEIADIYAQENLDKGSSTQESDSTDSTSSISASIIEQTQDRLLLEVSYESAEETDMYAGIAILREGISFAEITTPQDMKLRGSGKVHYSLDLNNLNSGTYQIGAGLFKFNNRELLAPIKKKPQFIIKGRDITKGAAMKLADSWTQPRIKKR